MAPKVLECETNTPHLHQCDKCQTVWAHDPGARAEAAGFPATYEGIYCAFEKDEEYAAQYERSHECPKCGNRETWVGDPEIHVPTLWWDGNEKKDWKDVEATGEYSLPEAC